MDWTTCSTISIATRRTHFPVRPGALLAGCVGASLHAVYRAIFREPRRSRRITTPRRRGAATALASDTLKCLKVLRPGGVLCSARRQLSTSLRQVVREELAPAGVTLEPADALRAPLRRGAGQPEGDLGVRGEFLAEAANRN